MTLNKIITVSIVIIIALFVGCSNKKEASNSSVNNTKGVNIRSSAKMNSSQKGAEKTDDKNSEKKTGRKEDAESDNKKVKEIDPIPEIKLDTKDVVLEWVSADGKMLSAIANEFSGNQKENKLSLRNFSGTLFEKGQKTAYIESPLAVADVKNKVVTIEKGVRIKSFLNKSTMVANKMVWFANKNKIYAYDGILTAEYGKVSGKFFELDTGLEFFEVSDKPK